MEDLVSLGIRLEQTILDAVVHHLHVMARPCWPDMRVALWRRQGLEDRLTVAEGGRRRADHEAVPDGQAPNAAARSRVDEFEALGLEGLGAAHRVTEIRIAAVDDYVPARKVRRELVDRAFRGLTGGDHDPHH